MDIQLPGQSGIECTARLKLVLPQTQILMFTIHAESELILQALRAGAIGYIFKSAAPEEILQAIREAKRGGSPMSGEAARKVVETFHREPAAALGIAQLTFREHEVMKLLAEGLADKQIADRLSISLLTINSHLKNIYPKLGVRSRTEAAIKYLNLL
jgi:DNA-binding NarL/FixJ family response regulator